MATVQKTEPVEIKPLDINMVKVRLVGDTPLIVHAWSEKAKRQMLEAQLKTAKGKAKPVRDPFAEFMDSMYWLTEKPEESTPEAFEKALKNGAKFGFPVTAIKQAGNSAAYRLGYVKNQMGLRGSYRIIAEDADYAVIEGCTPIMREDMVRIGQGSADLRYRAEFQNWHMDVILSYNANGEYSLEQLLNIMNLGGYACGVGEWRPERDGSFGTYHIEEIR